MKTPISPTAIASAVGSLLVMLVTALCPADPPEQDGDGKGSSQIKTVNPDVPELRLPDYSGREYEAGVPDTLDLAEMARSLVNAMTAPTDPDSDYEVYWGVVFGSNPPYMIHEFSDQIQFQYMACLPLMRMISGSRQGMDMEKIFLAATLRNVGEDGLFYNDPKACPWMATKDSCGLGVSNPDGHFAVLLQSSFLLHMIQSYGQYSGDERWLEIARRCVDSMIRLAVDKGDYAYYHKLNYIPGEVHSDGPVPRGFHAGWRHFYVPMVLLQYYDLTGYQPAADMAQKLTKFQSRYWKFPGEEGFCYAGYPVVASVMPMELGLRMDNSEMLEVAQQNFEKYLPHVDKFTGYVSEGIHTGSHSSTQHTTESCYLAWPINNAVVLSASGAGDYWDHVDRWVRNQFAEAQLRHTDWVGRMNADKPVTPIPPHSTSEGVLERNVGGFSGNMRINDWHHQNVRPRKETAWSLQHCCQARSAVAIYNVWKNILQHEGGKLRVNLLLNRASAVADIDSHIPYTGQVDVHVKEAVDLSVRIPEWVQPEDVRAVVDGQGRDITFSGRYAQLGRVSAGQTAVVSFPISERDEKTVVHGREYTLRIKGTTVVGISPQGEFCPVYQRAHYRENSTRWHKATRFLSDKIPIKESHALCF